ncbi:MAG: DNA polymerase III subunit alpha [Bacilli bacterium]
MNYVPLNIKTHNYLLHSMIKIDELITFAKENQLKFLTITDNNMFGAMEFYLNCKKNDITPIIGLELMIEGMPLILYCMNDTGYRHLLKLSTLMTEREITLDVLSHYSDSIICIVPFKTMRLYDRLVKIYQYIFKAYSSSEEKDKLKGTNLIYMDEVLYLKKDDAEYINYLYAIKEGRNVDFTIEYDDNYLKLYDEIATIIDLDSNQKIIDLCRLEIRRDKNLLPIYQCPVGYDSYQYLKKLCIDGLKRIFGTSVSQVYQTRLKYELSVIQNMGFCNYFLVVYDYVKFAKDNHILVGPGRGSAAGSLVSYLLNITTIDPIKYNLLFERFLNPERITMPDIDIDFEYNRREEVINYCIDKYGMKKVAPIITFGTLGAKQVIRDVARTMDIDLAIVDDICHLLDSRLSLTLNIEQNAKLAHYIASDATFSKLYQIATKLEGLKRHTSIHAAGIVMAKNDLDEVIPLVKNHEGFYITGYSMEYLEDLGLLKMDFLALRNLTLINDVLKDINTKEKVKLTFDSIPDGDKKAISVFTNVYTTGIFQFESQGMMNFLRKFKPNDFEDIVASIALFRPGPMNNIDSYIKRKRGKQAVDYLDESLNDILKPTYGIIIYQEQIMQIANVMAGYSFAEADVLRRAMSKKKESVLLEEKEKFIKRSIERGYSETKATQVYDLILRFASYGFNRAHSVAYSMIAYRMAYLKAYYPKYFMKNLLSMVVGSTVKTKEYIYECKLLDIDILLPDINYSGNSYEVCHEGIRFPLSSIKNVGISAATSILEERTKGLYKDIFDFINRCYGKSVNRKTLESLIDAGVFNSFGFNRHTLKENLEAIINYGEIGDLLSDDESLKPLINRYEEYSKKELMNLERDTFGFYLSHHPVTEYRIKFNNLISLEQIDNYFDKNINIILYVDRKKEITTKKNDKMLFITASDELATIDVVLFPKFYTLGTNINVGDIVEVSGHVEKRFDKYQLVANALEVIANN